MGIFTDYVVHLVETGNEPDPDRLAKVRKALASALRSELGSRGLLGQSPSFVGILGEPIWNREALEELSSEAYVYVFVRRLRGLQAQLQVKPNVDGLVRLNVRHLVHDRQKQCDPLGYRVFEIFRRAVRSAISRDELTVREESSVIRNDTIIELLAGGVVDVADAEDVRERVTGWTHDLLPDLVTARTKASSGKVVAELRRLLVDLAEWMPFRFGDALNPVKQESRSRWAAILDHHDGPKAIGDGASDEIVLVKFTRPSNPIEEKDAFQKLSDCVSRCAHRASGDGPRQAEILHVWELLRTLGGGEGDTPSQREVSRTLDVPRRRLRKHYEVLAGCVCRCRDEPAAEDPG